MKISNTFIGQSIKGFVKTGSILPSSNRLAKRMTKNIKSSVVLELGAGMGVFTKEILKTLPKDGMLISIELNEVFYEHLKNTIKDKRLRLCLGDATHAEKFLRENGVEKVSCIISGLPLGNFTKELRDKILREVEICLEEDGSFVQFQYFLASIKPIKKLFPKTSISFEFFNFPPAFVIRCKKGKK